MNSVGHHHACCAGAQRGAFALPGTTRKYERALPFRFTHLELDLQLDLKLKQVTGSATLHIERQAPEATQLVLDAINFDIHSVQLEHGKTRKNVAFSYDDEQLTIELGKRLKSGRVIIEYTAQPSRGLYFLQPDKAVKERPVQVWSQCQDEDARHWFPCHDKPHVKTSIDFRITVPSGFQVLCNGERTSAPARKKGDAPQRRGAQTHSFAMPTPVPTYLITLVVGHFDVLKDRPAKLPSGKEVPVEYWVPKGSIADGRRAFEQTPRMIELFSQLTGVEYPYSRYTQVVVSDFIFGGMENTTATTMYEHILLDRRAALDIESHDLVAHELAHQWFGDWVTCKDWIHAWLNEGFATYFEHVERESRLGRAEYLVGVERDLRSYLTEAKGRYSRPIVTRTYAEPIDLFDRHLYEQGGLVLHMLRERLGSTVFWQGIRKYLSSHGGQHATTEDLRAALEQVSGQSLERFFDEWVLQAGHPRLGVTVKWDKSELTISIEQKQPRKFELLFSCELLLKNGKTRRVSKVLHAQHEAIVLSLGERPEYVAIDPELTIAGEIIVQIAAPMTRAQLAHGSTERIRRLAAKQLENRLDFKSLAALGQALSDEQEHWSVRVSVAQTLGKSRTESAFDSLTSASKTAAPKVRAAIASALGNFRTAASATLLKQLLTREPSYLVEAAATAALGKTQASGVEKQLKLQLKRKSWGQVIACASIEGLAALENPAVADTLRAATEYGNAAYTRRAAIKAFAKIAESSAACPQLGRLLEDRDPHIRASIVGALHQIGDAGARRVLNEHAPRERDGRVKRKLNEALRELNAPNNQRELANKLARLEVELSELKATVSKLSKP